MRNNESSVWLFVVIGVVAAAVGLFFFMGGSIDDVEAFIRDPRTGLYRAGDSLGRTMNSAGESFGRTMDSAGGGFTSPTKSIGSSVGNLGSSIGGALGGAGR